MLKTMFSTVAETYDLANKVLTFGLDKRWRRACVRESPFGRYVVDLCCGTGDLTLNLLPNIKAGSFILGLDFSKEMLARAVVKNKKTRKSEIHYAFVNADAAHLPLRNEFIDDIRISFSFRNLIYKNPQANTYLKEVSNALKDGGRLTCVETSQPKNCLVRRFFQFYCLRIVPFVGGLLSGRKPAYKYLGKSAANFPFPKEILIMMKKVGLADVAFKPLSFGIVGLYMAVK